MAYPEPIPPLRGRAAKEFAKKLDEFKLSKKQRELFRGAKGAYLKSQSRRSNKR